MKTIPYIVLLSVLFAACGPSAEQTKLLSDFKSTVEQLASQDKSFQETEASMKNAHTEMERKYDSLKAQGINIPRHDSIIAAHQNIAKSRKAMREAHLKTIADYQAKVEAFTKQMPSVEVLKQAYASAMSDLDNLKKDYEKMKAEHDQMHKDHEQMKADYASLPAKDAKKKK